MSIRGKIWKFGNDVDTDVIIPARYLNTSDQQELACHCMEDADPDFVRKVAAGDIILAGKNFGCGSSREHAPVAIKGAGIRLVIAESFARIFYRNAFNIGLPILELPQSGIEIEEGDDVGVDIETGVITDHTTGKQYTANPIPQFMRELLAAGGLVSYVRSRRATIA
ncbi:MAG: 3-isopropylmalate dehydratase small subunit [Desulfobacteraceae bacterium]|nr:MAG: 3-isopropylmalate dehydratase small subunit [Desulfobacteraceae bacterium]